jgi:hypothetical protein
LSTVFRKHCKSRFSTNRNNDVVTNRNNDNDGEKIVAEIGYGPGPVGIVFSILGEHGSGGKLGGELHWPVWASCPGAKSEAP